MTAYHITLLKNVPSIAATGLIPQVGRRSTELREPRELIYLFANKSDMEHAMLNWLGDWYTTNMPEEPLAILEIQIPDSIQCLSVGYELQCSCAIPPAYIRFFDESMLPITEKRST